MGTWRWWVLAAWGILGACHWLNLPPRTASSFTLSGSHKLAIIRFDDLEPLRSHFVSLLIQALRQVPTFLLFAKVSCWVAYR